MFAAGRSAVFGERFENGKKIQAVPEASCDHGGVNILIVEDDRRLAELLARRLRERGHEVQLGDDGLEALALARSGTAEVMVLDVMLPGKDGLSVIRELRGLGVDIPVLLLTARDTVEDRVHGLGAGADDYLVKPFAFEELLARLEALDRRRRGSVDGTVLRQGPLSLDPGSRRAWVDSRELDLTAKEFDLLLCLVEHRGKVLTRKQLKDLVWDFSFDARTKVVDLYVHYLRRKLGEHGDLIQTVRGVGYAVGR